MESHVVVSTRNYHKYIICNNTVLSNNNFIHYLAIKYIIYFLCNYSYCVRCLENNKYFQHNNESYSQVIVEGGYFISVDKLDYSNNF